MSRSLRAFAWGGGLGLTILIGLFALPDWFAHDLRKVWLRFPGLDKAAHFLAYAGALLAVDWMFRAIGRPAAEGNRLTVAAMLCVVVAAVDEAQQAFVAGRLSESSDFVADISGVLFALTWLTAARLGRTRALIFGALALVPLVIVTASTYGQLSSYYQGMAYQRAHDYPAARAAYARAVATGLRNAGLFNQIAWLEIEFLDGDPVEAGWYAAQAVTMEPDNPAFLDTYGWILVRQGKARAGLAWLERARALDADLTGIDYHLGAAYAELGEADRAVRHLKRQVARHASNRFGRAAQAVLDRLEERSG